MSADKPWAGRFTQATDPRVEIFTESVSFDQRLAPHDIRGSVAHATMMGDTKATDTIARIHRRGFTWFLAFSPVEVK